MEEQLEDSLLLSLPDELLIHILKYLSMEDLTRCSLTCNKMYSLAQDFELDGIQVIKDLKKTENLEDLFLLYCREGKAESVKFLVNYFVKNGPPCCFQILWNCGFVEAVKGGNKKLVRILISYGVNSETAKEVSKFAQEEVLELIRENFPGW